MKHYFKYGIFLLISILLPACVNDDFSVGSADSGQETNVKVTMQMPSSSPGTYAISEIDENYVSTIDVLVFKPSGGNWVFAYKAEGADISEQPVSGSAKEKKQFNVTLIKSNGQQLVTVLANVRTQVEALGQIAVGADKDELLNRLVFENAGSWNANNGKAEDAPDKTFTPFPMWGEVTTRIDDATATIKDVSMLRGIARVDVVLDGAVKNFKLDEVYIYNSKNKGQIVPAPANLANPAMVNAATVPAGDINNAAALKYVVPSSMSSLFERSIYLFEAKAVAQDKSSEATCMVVGGKYDADGKTTYYRLDFFEKDANGDYTGNYRDVLRNFRYRANITSVSGSGYPTPQEAFNSKPLNMQVQIEDWDDGSMGDVVFDGAYALSVAPGEYNLTREAYTTAMDAPLSIYTDYPSGWSIEKIVDFNDETVPATWLSVRNTAGDEVAKGDAGKKESLWLKVDENNTPDTRKAKIVVLAGRMRFNLAVTQSNVTGTEVLIYDPGTNQPLTDLTFVSAKNVPETSPKRFAVKWKPGTTAISVDVLPFQTMPLFRFDTSGGNDEIITGTLAGGLKEYSILPKVVTDADLPVGNPFPQFISKVDYILFDGNKMSSQSIFLRQIVYNLVTEVEPGGYLMDGDEHSFTLKANYPWTAEVVSKGPSGQDVITGTLSPSSGGANTAGVEVKFNTISFADNKTLTEGDAEIRIRSVNGEYPDEIVKVHCTLPPMQPPSNSYMITPGDKLGIMFPVSPANAAQAGAIGPDDVLTAELMWTDHRGGMSADAAIKAVAVMGKGNTGSIAVVPGTSEGNALVVVKVNREIKWSWHIWVTNYTGSNPKGYKGRYLMDRNIGCINGYEVAAHVQGEYAKTGLHYQWGRKDPFSRAGKLYNASGTGVAPFDKQEIVGLANSISKPNTFFSKHSTAGAQDWYTDNPSMANHSLWGNNSSKTIYDPCPPGWRVPSSGAGYASPWSGLALNEGTWNAGITWSLPYDLGYYPTSGYLAENANSVLVGVSGYCWSAASAQGIITGGQELWSSSCLLVNENMIDPQNVQNRIFAMPVRCERDK